VTLASATPRQGARSPAAAAQDGLLAPGAGVARRLRPHPARLAPLGAERPSRNRPAETATRSCVNKDRIRRFTCRSEQAHNSSASSTATPATRDLQTVPAQQTRDCKKGNCNASSTKGRNGWFGYASFDGRGEVSAIAPHRQGRTWRIILLAMAPGQEIGTSAFRQTAKAGVTRVTSRVRANLVAVSRLTGAILSAMFGSVALWLDRRLARRP
jgi:hypothetical protein